MIQNLIDFYTSVLETPLDQEKCRFNMHNNIFIVLSLQGCIRLGKSLFIFGVLFFDFMVFRKSQNGFQIQEILLWKEFCRLRANVQKNRTKSNFFGKARKLNFARLLHIASP